jgi:hypothetical protein
MIAISRAKVSEKCPIKAKSSKPVDKQCKPLTCHDWVLRAYKQFSILSLITPSYLIAQLLLYGYNYLGFSQGFAYHINTEKPYNSLQNGGNNQCL